MSDPFKHHYLPVFYLSRWAGVDGRLFRYHRPYRDVVVHPLTPEYTAFEEELYSLASVPPEHRQTIETSFMSAAVDGPAAPLIEKLLDKERGVATLTGDERVIVARFLMSLRLRDPFSLSEIKEMANGNIRENLSRAHDAEYLAERKPGDPDTLYEWALQKAPLYMADAHMRMLPGLIDHEGIGQHLIGMRWGIMDLSASPHTLITADRPVIRTHGLKDPRVIFAVPLSPRHLFIAGNGIAELRKLNTQPVKDTVRNMNNMVARVAVTNVYGDGPRHQTFIEKRLRRLDETPHPGVISGTIVP